MTLNDFLNISTVASSGLMVLLILAQARGATLGAGFGELYTTRRGLDKSLYDATIVCTVVFILSILAGILIG